MKLEELKEFIDLTKKIRKYFLPLVVEEIETEHYETKGSYSVEGINCFIRDDKLLVNFSYSLAHRVKDIGITTYGCLELPISIIEAIE